MAWLGFRSYQRMISGLIGAALLSSFAGCERSTSPQPVIVVPAADATAAAQPTAVEFDGIFPVELNHQSDGMVHRLKLTGTAVRKAMLLKVYQIASYCDDSTSPTCVDTLAAADVPKQLCLTMERDIPASILSRGFKEAFEKNDPEGKFADESKTMLDHMLKAPLKEGESVWITHRPGQGITVRVRDEEPIAVNNPEFAHLVWRVYMGPQGVCPKVREGLGERLAAAPH